MKLERFIKNFYNSPYSTRIILQNHIFEKICNLLKLNRKCNRNFNLRKFKELKIFFFNSIFNVINDGVYEYNKILRIDKIIFNYSFKYKMFYHLDNQFGYFLDIARMFLKTATAHTPFCCYHRRVIYLPALHPTFYKARDIFPSSRHPFPTRHAFLLSFIASCPSSSPDF